MQRLHQFVFVASLLALSWLVMMAVHELGHVVGATWTRGNVERVVLHPLAISRTDVSPNPKPAIVVWAGPILGCIVPVIVWLLIPRRAKMAHTVAMFFAGFCLLANGAYIAVGSFDHVGDCGEMLRTGSPFWTLLAFGITTMPLGLCLWHRAGSVKQFIADPTLIPARTAYAMLFVLLVVVAGEIAFSPS
jgi:hypothetical protein